MPESPLSPVLRERDAVGRQAALRLFADAGGRGLLFALFYAAQRALGPALYGHVTWALALGFLLASATSLGMPLIITREIARTPADAARVAGAGLAFKLILTLGAVGILGAAALTRPPDVRLATLMVGLAAITMSFVEFIGHVLRGLHRFHHETGLLLALRVLTLGLGGWALWSGRGIVPFAAAYLGAAALTLLLAWIWLARRFVTPRLHVDPEMRGRVLSASLPLGAAAILAAAYTRTPVFVLDVLRGPAVVGVYGVAQKLTEPLALIPSAVMAAVFPVISRDGGITNRRLHPALAASLKAAAGAGAIVAVTGALLGPWLIDTLYPPAFADAGLPLQILALSTLPVFLNYVLTHVLVVLDRQGLNLAFTATVFVANVVLCLLIASAYGAAGGAVAMLVCELLLLSLCTVTIRRIRRADASSGEAGARP